MSTPSSDPAGRFDFDAFYRGDKPAEDVPAVCTVPVFLSTPRRLREQIIPYRKMRQS